MTSQRQFHKYGILTGQSKVTYQHMQTLYPPLSRLDDVGRMKCNGTIVVN